MNLQMRQFTKESIARLLMGLILCLAIAGCEKGDSEEPPSVFGANGDINSVLNLFRNTLGSLNSTTGQTTGRREINWDGVPDAMNGIKLSADFFNPTDAAAPESLKRGVMYGGDADAMVSSTGFSEVNVDASASFASFSGNKNFAVVNATLWPVTFQVAGQDRAATINAFGAVFSDVDNPNSTFIEFFDGTNSLGRFYVPPHDNTTSFSFLGVYFPNSRITDINIGHEGRLSDGAKDISQGGTKDLVVLDDFIYSEPLAR
jgi:hypothetical protein